MSIITSASVRPPVAPPVFIRSDDSSERVIPLAKGRDATVVTLNQSKDPDLTYQPSSLSKPTIDDLKQEKQIEQQERLDEILIKELSARDREVRNHEQAHAAVGGQYAGAPSYTYQKGPDGVNYAVGGEVSIDTSPIPGNPEATLNKAAQVKRAALAPAEPSAQDRKVAAVATQIQLEALNDLVQKRTEQSQTERVIARDEALNSDHEPSNVAVQSTSTEKAMALFASNATNTFDDRIIDHQV